MREIYGARYVSHIQQRAGGSWATLFGQKYLVLGASDISSVDRIRGKSIKHLFGDEGPTWPPEVLQIVKSQLDKPWSVADIPGNPEYPRHHFKVDLIDRAADLDVYVSEWTIDDNPTLDPQVVMNMKRELRGVWYKRWIEGIWAAASGAIYDMLTGENYYTETLARLRYHSDRYIVIDYGTHNPFACMDILDDGKTVWIDDELYWDSTKEFRQKTPDQYAADYFELVARRPKQPPAMTIIDPSALEFITTLKAKGVVVTPADNDVPNGIARVAKLIAKQAIMINRIRCPHTVAELQAYAWDEKAAAVGGKEIPVKVDDHLPDDLRYFCNTALPKWRLSDY
jgi:hypothetical protein